MNKLSLCRMCRVGDLSMRFLNNVKLQELYEKLTGIPFETKDNRPSQVCYICYAILEKCYVLQVGCLKSKRVLAQKEGNNELKPKHLQDVNKLRIIHPLILFVYPPLQVPAYYHDHDSSTKDDVDVKSDLQYIRENVEDEEFGITRSLEDAVKTEYVDTNESASISQEVDFIRDLKDIKTECVNSEVEVEIDFDYNIYKTEAEHNLPSKTNCMNTEINIRHKYQDPIMAKSENSMEYLDTMKVELDRHCSRMSTSIATTKNIRVKTTAELSKEYRARIKKTETQAASNLYSIHHKHPKTAAQRMREYRARIKKETSIVICQKRRKKEAQRKKEYRARKKAKIHSADSTMAESTNSEESSNALIVQVDVPHRYCSQLSASIATTNNVCVTENQTMSDLPTIKHGYPKTAAERMREYRARKKKENPIVNHLKRKKSGAERAKEYRARKKAKMQSASKIFNQFL